MLHNDVELQDTQLSVTRDSMVLSLFPPCLDFQVFS